MKRIVYEHYPAAKLPDQLRGCIDLSSTVTVTIVQEAPRPERVMTLEEIFALRGRSFRTSDEIDADLRRQRDEWDD